MLLLTRPNHDDTVSYLYDWSEDVLQFAEERGVKKKDISDEDVTRTNVENFILSQKPRLIVFNGHGDERSIGGHKDEPVLDTDNVHILKDSIVYAIACDAAKVLGTAAVSKGAAAFIGYIGKFGWIIDPSRISVPSKDRRAEPFKIFSNSVCTALLQSKPAREAYVKGLQIGSKLIREYSTSDSEDVNEAIRFMLFRNMQLLKLLGNGDAKYEQN